MQSVQEAVHEYIYQFTIAQDTQQKLCEIAYTTAITIISTAITMAVTYGMGVLAKGVSNYMSSIPDVNLGWSSGSYNSLYSTAASSTSFISRLGENFISLASKGLNSFFIATGIACISETLQEIYLDPWIEATMTNLVADAGLGVFWQAFFSGLVEGGRESFIGPIASSARNSLDIKNNLRTEQMLDQNQQIMIEPDLQQQEVSYAKQFATSSLILFGTLLVSGFLGSLIGPSVGAGLMATVIIFLGDGDEDGMDKNELAKAQLARLAEIYRIERVQVPLLGNIYGGYDFDPLWNRISDEQWSIFTEGQEIVREEQNRISPLSKVKDWLKEHKKGFIGMVTAYIGIGIVSSIFPVIGTILSLFPAFTLGMVARQTHLDVSVRQLVKAPNKLVIYEQDSIRNTISKFLSHKKPGTMRIYLDRKQVDIQLSNRQFSYTSAVSLQEGISQEEYNAIQPIESRVTIFTHTAKKLMEIYSKTKKVGEREVFGIIYLIIDWETGKLKVGRTERSLRDREEDYLIEARKYRENNEIGRLIIQRINELYAQGGDKRVKSTLEWIPIEVILRSGQTDEHIAFDKKLIENLEQLWQNKLGTKAPQGYDDTSGAAGAHSKEANHPSDWTKNLHIPTIILNYRHLQNLLEKGCDYNQMVTEVSKFYPGIPINKELIIENIEYHWPHIATEANTRTSNLKAQTLLKSARYYFIAPKIKQYVENGMTNTKDIARQFRSKENPAGISTQTILRAVAQEYQVSSWAEFLSQCQAPLSPQSLLSLSPEDYKSVGGESLDLYNNYLIDSYVIKGYTLEEIDELMPQGSGYTWRNLERRYGGIYNARKQLVGPILALCFKKGLQPAEIRQKMPFFQRRMPTSKAWHAVRHYCLEWFKINPSSARAALAHQSLNSFLIQYLNI